MTQAWNNYFYNKASVKYFFSKPFKTENEKVACMDSDGNGAH